MYAVIDTYMCSYISFFSISGASVSDVTVINAPNVTSKLYNITFTCTVYPDSTADQCVVMAMADGRVTRTGDKANNMYECILVHSYTL